MRYRRYHIFSFFDCPETIVIRVLSTLKKFEFAKMSLESKNAIIVYIYQKIDNQNPN
jgi:hypothetical protein